MGVAPLRLRLQAALVDSAIIVAGMGAAMGGGVAGAVLYKRVRGDKGDPPVDRNRWDATRWSSRSRQLRGAVWGASAGLAIPTRNWRSPGYRLVGLRRVDARTGGPVSVRSVLIGQSFDQVWQPAWGSLFRSRLQRHQTRLQALAPQLRAVQRRAASDPQARSRAIKEFYASNSVNPVGACGWVVAGPFLSQVVMALSARDGRTIRDRITGTRVIVER